MTKQLQFLPPESPEDTFTDPGLPKEAKPRLGGQNAAVLARLREGPATNVELEALAGRVNSRAADVRRWLQKNEGKTIKSEKIDGKKGIYRYEITEI